MKGVKTCLKLLALFVMPLLCLCQSSDVSAKYYSIDSFLSHGIFLPVSANGGIGVGEPFVSVTSASDLEGVHPRNTSYIWADYNSSTQKCDYYSYNNPGYSISGNNIFFEGSFYAPFLTNDDLSDFHKCNTMYPFGTNSSEFNINIPSFNNDSVPFNNSINVASMLPYHYMYNTFPIHGTRTVDGVEYSSNFDISELLNQNHVDDSNDSNITYYTDIIKTFHLPINFDSSLESISADTPVKVSGSFDLGSGFTTAEAYAISVSIGFIYTTPGGGSEGITLPCATSSSNSKFSFVCVSTTNLPHPSKSYGFLLEVTTSNSALSSSKTSFTFTDFYVTLNGEDDIYGGNGSFFGNGSFPNVAPGMPDINNPENGDFFSSLTGLFNFDFFNPFAGIFNLFSDQNSCASIPTIASMIHSEETTICPWFDSTTRNIVTPVLGLASAMLIFGFAVRWLGARSGNLFEDSMETDNYSFANKFRRKK